MNKILLLAALSGVVLFTSCKEKGAIINTSGTKPTDTSYMAAVEQPQKKVVLIEEFTGVSCPPCPKGHILIYDKGGLIDQHPGQIAVIAYHYYNYPQTEPIHGISKYDFRTDDATNVNKIIFGSANPPSAGVDRVKSNNTYLLDRTEWAQAVNVAVTKAAPVNVTITSAYDPATRNATITVRAAYTEAVAKKQSLTLALIENNIIDAQKVDFEIQNDYVHKAVLRHILTQFYGEPIIDNIGTKEPGRVYERTFAYNVNPAWNADNCQLVAFVHNNEGDDKYVQQAAEANLKQ